MLQIYNLRKSLDQTRKELAHALYQHDAACRVIARLIKEKDQAEGTCRQAKEELATSQMKLQILQRQIDQGKIEMNKPENQKDSALQEKDQDKDSKE